MTAEMLVHDVDDERTIEEEESGDIGECFSNELDELAEVCILFRSPLSCKSQSLLK